MKRFLRTTLAMTTLLTLGVVAASFDAIAQVSAFDTSINAVGVQYDFAIQQQQAQMAAAIEAQNQAAAQLVKQQKMQSISSFVVGACGALFSKEEATEKVGDKTFTEAEDLAYTAQQAAYEEIDKAPYSYGQKWNQDEARAVGADATANFGSGCDKFMNKDGQLGPWGQFALQQIKEKPDAFGDNVPDDIQQWCPKYKSMKQGEDVSKRELYWVWILMSMASSESSCNPNNDNPNAPNGTAKGLFQVWKPVCPKARNLNNPYENIQCAIDLLAKEMTNRDTIMTPTSKGREGTYWGPLRSDDWNKRRGGDIKGAQKTRGLMSKYRYCK